MKHTLQITKVTACCVDQILIGSGLKYVALGRTRFDRLFLIGTSSVYLHLEALKAAIEEAKRGKNVGRYESAVHVLQELAPRDPDAELDHHWIEKTTRQVKAETERLETELKGYKNNLIKESIRVSSVMGRSNSLLIPSFGDGLR